MGSPRDGRRRKGGTLPLGTPAASIPSPAPRKKGGTLPLGTPAPKLPDDTESGRDTGGRGALMLPPELSPEERAARATLPGTPKKKPKSYTSIPPDAPRGSGSGSLLPERLSRVSQWAGVGHRTSILEIAGSGTSLSRVTYDRLTRTRFGYRLVVAVMALSLLLLIVALAVLVGQWRWIPLGILFLQISAVIAYVSVRSLLPRLARRFGEVRLPGRAGMYVGIFVSAIASTGGIITWGVSRGSVLLGRTVLPVVAPGLVATAETTAVATVAPPDPTQAQPESDDPGAWDTQVWVRPGILFMPHGFQAENGEFDVIVHFHGAQELVRDSVGAAGLNALVIVVNYGQGSGGYQSRFAIPGALDDLLRRAEEKASAKFGSPLKTRRIALTSWSAGYGAILSLLLDKAVFDRVDTVITLDGIHGGFAPEGNRVPHPAAIAPFVEFAKEAVAGRKLMMITHSAIETTDYFSSTESADAIIAAVGAKREKCDPSTESPPQASFETAVDAFPSHERKWLQVRSMAHAGNFHVLGCTGNEKGDHIAHLAQMSLTVLPELKKRWK